MKNFHTKILLTPSICRFQEHIREIGKDYFLKEKKHIMPKGTVVMKLILL